MVGSAPLVENIATLIDPPGSDYDEIDWINSIMVRRPAACCSTCTTFTRTRPTSATTEIEFLKRLPAERIGAVHLAGGKWVEALGERRLLDDHLHDVPDAVYRLLAELAAVVPHPLTVILERDGAYPPIEVLLRQLDRAREALAKEGCANSSE